VRDVMDLIKPHRRVQRALGCATGALRLRDQRPLVGTTAARALCGFNRAADDRDWLTPESRRSTRSGDRVAVLEELSSPTTTSRVAERGVLHGGYAPSEQFPSRSEFRASRPASADTPSTSGNSDGGRSAESSDPSPLEPVQLTCRRLQPYDSP